jgi:uncharacterized protein
VNLSAAEIRVLGCLLEKQRTTPDAYPLSLNALRLACNQSTNRDPVVRYDDATIRDALHRLERRGYTRLASGAGSRAPKYRHLLAEALPLTDDEHAVLCVLMLRGGGRDGQTVGELKQRAERMHRFAGLDDVHATLAKLIERELAARLGRRPGQKEERYGQLLGDADADAEQGGGVAAAAYDQAAAAYSPTAAGHAPAAAAHNHAAYNHAGAEHAAGAMNASAGTIGSPSSTPDLAAATSVDGLEQRVARLEREVAELRAALGSRL